MSEFDKTIETDQQGNPDAGVHATTAEPKLRAMTDLIKNYPGKPWREAAGRLAQWTLDRLVNRTDVYRIYKSMERRRWDELLTYTGPWFEESRDYGSLCLNTIEEHYHGCDPNKMIGLHAISIDNTSRWFVINVDQQDANGAILAEANANAAFDWYEDLQMLGFKPLLLDANGAGGYHVLVCLSEEVSSQVVHEFATDFVQNFAEYGLKTAPEVYPSEPDVNPHRPYG